MKGGGYMLRGALCAALVVAFGLLSASAPGAPRGARADLVVLGVSAPTTARTGEAIVAWDRTHNAGRRRSPATLVGYFLSSSRRGGARLMVGKRHVPALGPRRGSRRATRLGVPPGLAPGRYFLIACADALGRVAERVERNNCRGSRRQLAVTQKTVSVTPQPPQPPQPPEPTAPETPELLGRPPELTNSTEAELTFARKDGLTYRCGLDLTPGLPCTSPARYTGLGEGAHVFSVTAVGPSGLESGPATHGWVVDVTPPSAPRLDATPADQTQATAATFSFSSPGASSYSCRLDDSAAVPCASPRTYSELGEGVHRFAVLAHDAAGNTSAETSFGWTVDRMPPPAPVVRSGPDNLTNSTRATFELDGAATAGVEWLCRLDAAPEQTCGTPHSYAGPLTEGTHRFVATARDRAGNEQSTAYSWTVDTTPPPAPWLTGRPENPTVVREATFTFVDSEPGVTFRCWRDGGPIEWCPSPHTYWNLADGEHRFTVIARDDAGNWSAQATVRWLIDNTAPPAPTLDLGLFPGPRNIAGVVSFQSWLKRPITRVLDYFEWGTWASIESPREIDAWKGTGYRMVYSVPLIPFTGGSLQQGATGAYNDHFVKLAQRLVAAGQADSTLRLGWEFNGWWYPWTAMHDPAAFIAYWRQIVTAMRGVPGARFTFDWSPNFGPSSVNADLAYPGDAYVDYIGISVFDQDWYPGWEDPRLRWRNLVELPYGLQWQRDFAAAHGKQVAIDEWGLTWRSDGHGGGDDPYYVEKMYRWLNATKVAWALYFEFDKEDGNHTLMSNQFPTATTRFRQLFGL